jgi:hypothetical protein
LTGTMLFSTTATASSNVGNYAINGSGYSWSNYDFNFSYQPFSNCLIFSFASKISFLFFFIHLSKIP